MSEIDVIALYQGVTEEAFRLEARQRYNVPYEEPLVRAFLEGRPQPANECMTNHFASVHALRAAGKRDYRVHVIELPLTPYLRYELSVYSTRRVSRRARRSSSPTEPGTRTLPS